MQRVFISFLFMIFFPLQMFAGLGDVDNRYRVTRDMWATEPYNKFVFFEKGVKVFGGFQADFHCSAQYIAPNLILSAGHCKSGYKKAKYRVTNYRGEDFEIVPVYTEFDKELSPGVNDWAVWLIKDPKYFSDTYFEPYKITQQTDFINAGWGWVRIMTNDEIENIFDVLYSLYGKEADNMTVEEIAEKLRTEMKKMGIPPLEETRLMASRCHSIEQENCEEAKKELDEIQKKQKDLYDSFFKCIPQECKTKLNEDLNAYENCIPQKCEELSCVYCEEYFSCIPQECETKKIEAYDKYNNCIPQDCKAKHTMANDLQEKIELYGVLNECEFNHYPYVIEHTCRTWGGNSGGGFVSQDGKIYGVVSNGIQHNGKKGLLEREGFMASSWQFEKKVKELREIYSTQNTPNENLKKIPKNIVVEKQTNNTETNLSNMSLEKYTYLKSTYKRENGEDINDDEEYTKEEIAELITTRKQELSEKNTEILNQIKQSKKFNLNEKLQLLGEITEYSVQSDRLEKLQRAYEDAKANEQSLANRMLTAATVAATGIGGMELARGLAEQSADKAAEQDMAAYIETMRCTYGDGKQVKAGPEEIELPGGNDATMMLLRNEYFALAADLKERKEAMGLTPGIESETILDKSQMGLYDDENIGIENGAYASIYRATVLGNETDQGKIDEDKEASKKRVTGGGVAAGVGAVGGIVGNFLINEKSKDTDTNK